MKIDEREIFIILRAMLSIRFSTLSPKEQQQHVVHPDPSFVEYYRQNIHKNLVHCEKERVKTLKTLRFRGWLSLFFLLLIFVLTLGIVAIIAFENEKNNGMVYIFTLFAIRSVYLWCTSPLEDYAYEVKTILFPKVIAYFGEGFI